MSYDTEKALKIIMEKIQKDNPATKEEAERLMGIYVQQYNDSLKNHQLDEYDYIQMAMEADVYKERVKYVKAALKINPDSIDAKRMQIEIEQIDDEERIDKLLKLIPKAEKLLLKNGVDINEDMGELYLILEARPLMRLYGAVEQHEVDDGHYGAAADICEKMLIYDENDHLGFRYRLMVLYAFFERVEEAEKLSRKTKEKNAGMYLPLAALYYRKRDFKRAAKAAKALCEHNRYVTEALDILINADEKTWDKIGSLEGYTAGSIEEILLAWYDGTYVYSDMNCFADWLYGIDAEVTEKAKAASKRSN